MIVYGQICTWTMCWVSSILQHSKIIYQAPRAHNFFKTYLVSKCKQCLLHVALVLRQFLQHFKEIILRPKRQRLSYGGIVETYRRENFSQRKITKRLVKKTPRWNGATVRSTMMNGCDRCDTERINKERKFKGRKYPSEWVINSIRGEPRLSIKAEVREEYRSEDQRWLKTIETSTV